MGRVLPARLPQARREVDVWTTTPMARATPGPAVMPVAGGGLPRQASLSFTAATGRPVVVGRWCADRDMTQAYALVACATTCGGMMPGLTESAAEGHVAVGKPGAAAADDSAQGGR